MTQPGAITATSLHCILLLLQLSKGIPGGILEELRHQSLPDLCKDRLTDRSGVGDGVQIENSGSYSNMPKDSVNSCIRLIFLFLATLRRLFRALLTDSKNVAECCCCCSLDAGSELAAAAAAASSPVNNGVCNVITRSLLFLASHCKPCRLDYKV